MSTQASRRNFLSAGLALPAAGVAATRLNSPLSSPEPSFGSAPQSGVKLNYTTLGKTGLKVTKVSMGCMITSDQSVVERAADQGIIYFDTARSYQQGNNERMVGTALRDKRKDLVIASKTQGRDKATFFEHLDTSLSTLGTDYIDIWYLHARSSPDDITDELMEAMQEAKKQGKIRFAGVSTHSGQQTLIPALARNSEIDVILTAFNFTMKDDKAMADALAEAHQAGKGIVGMKVMAGGFRRAKGNPELSSILERKGAIVAMLKWVLNNPNIDTTIPSITDMEQLEQDMEAMSSPYSEQDDQLLAERLNYIRPLYCSTCGACAGQCRKGLPVSDILRHLSYAEGYGQFQLARENYLELPRQIQDVRCVDCDECLVQCPNGVQVSQRLALAQDMLA